MLVEKFYVQDIRDYEQKTKKSVLKMFQDLRVSYILELMKLGNRGMTDDEASARLDYYLTKHSLMDALEEIKVTMFGEVTDEQSSVSIGEYDTLTEVYNKMCFEIMTVGISYSEFWSFSTLDMYDAFNACTIKLENDINNQLSLSYNQAALVAAAVWGKLPKEVPHVDLVEKPEEVIYVEGYGELTMDEYRDLIKMKAMVR